MERTRLATVLALTALVSGGFAFVAAQSAPPPAAPAKAAEPKEPEGDESEEIPFEKAPEAVRAAALRLVAGDAKHITKVIREEDEDDVVSYEVEFTVGDAACAAILTQAGEVKEVERPTTEAKLPAAVVAAVRAAFPGAKIEKPMVVTRTFYEVQVTVDGKTVELLLDPAGQTQDTTPADGEAPDEAKAPEAPKAPAAGAAAPHVAPVPPAAR